MKEIKLNNMNVDDQEENNIEDHSDSSVECHALDELDRKPHGKKIVPSKKMRSITYLIPRKTNNSFTKMQSIEDTTASDMEALQVAFEDDMILKDML